MMDMNCWIYPQLLISASSILDEMMLSILKVSGPLNDVKIDTCCIPLNAFTSVFYTLSSLDAGVHDRHNCPC